MLLKNKLCSKLTTADVAAENERPIEEEEVKQIMQIVANIIESRKEKSPLIESNPVKALPIFHPDEIDVGDALGRGEFGIVREVTDIHTRTKRWASERLLMLALPNYSSLKTCETQSATTANNSGNNNEKEETAAKSLADNDGSNDRNENSNDHTPETRKDITEEERKILKSRCYRDGRARYAMKRLRTDFVSKDRRLDGAIDLATEAMLLSSLMHPNIVRLRGIIGSPGHPEYGLMLDRLYSTLAEKLKEWKKESRKLCMGSVMEALSIKRKKGNIKSRNKNLQFFLTRLYTAFDTARALKYLHERKVIYRDLKPDNIGYEIRGDLRIFDLGLSKELTDEYLLRLPDDYELTGMTGSRRWMAPEVHLCLPYGFSADVYSYGLLFWNIFSLKIPFGADLTVEGHFDRVVVGGERPPVENCGKILPKPIQEMMILCWDVDRKKRPSFADICVTLQLEIESLEHEILDRTDDLLCKSRLSIKKSKDVAGTLALLASTEFDK